MTEQWSYWRVLRTGRVAPLLLGDVVSNVGDGMLLTALPVLTLWSAGSVLAAPIGLAMAGPLVTAAGPTGGLAVSAVLTLVLALFAGMSGTRRRPTPPPG